MRPTGKLHLGNYVGALSNWVNLQNEFENYHLVADWHVLTTSYEDTTSIGQDILDMVIDWLAAGINPDQSPMFVQSHIKEHAELHLLFSMMITQARLERNPTLKEQIRDLNTETISYGHLGYPVLQTADILLYKADTVPVGEDQAPHVEISREIARRFNYLYGDVFPEPDVKLTKFPRLPGIDGKKMSKSAKNAIFLSDSPKNIEKQVMSAITDPKKIRLGDPGRPEICNVFAYHEVFNPDEVEQIRTDCKSGALGCVVCKKNCAEKLSLQLLPFREKRKYYESNIDEVKQILSEGDKKASVIAKITMDEVRNAMKVGII